MSQKRAHTRERLITAALDVVARTGFHGASVDLIATQAGMSIGALYSNFSGKDDLFLAVFDRHVTWFEHHAQVASASPDLAAAFAYWMELLTNEREQFLVFVEFWSYAVRRPTTHPEFAVRMRQMQHAIRNSLDTLTSARGNELAIPADLLALVVLAIGRGLTLERLADPDAVPDARVGQLITALLG